MRGQHRVSCVNFAKKFMQILRSNPTGSGINFKSSGSKRIRIHNAVFFLSCVHYQYTYGTVDIIYTDTGRKANLIVSQKVRLLF
jgi:hypothetical protein